MIPDAAWVAVVVTLITACLALVWRSAGTVTRVEMALDRLEHDIRRIESMGESVQRIPVVEARLTMMAEEISRLQERAWTHER